MTGEYTSQNYGIINKAIIALKKESYVLNSVLVLNSDSSYLLNTCGNIIKGKWNSHNDSLFLFCIENYIIKDSIRNSTTPICGGKPSIYIVKQNKSLKLQSHYYHKEHRVLNNLIKTEYFGRIK